MSDSQLSSPSTAAPGETNPLRRAHISFVGCGVMGEAMMSGLLRRQLVNSSQITASHPRANRRAELETKYGVRAVENNREAATAGSVVTGTPRGEDNDDNSPSGSIIVIGVKPQRIGGVMSELKGAFTSDQLVLSIVAGARLETIAAELRHPAIVRAMPNTPAQVGQGMTVWTATPEVSEDQCRAVAAMLGALGREMRVEEERMIDMATALSATGPTYIFMMMEALVDAGVHMGFSRHVAQELVLQTMLGSVLFAQESHKHPAELRNMVTSPGGTSAEAIYQMEKGGLRTVFSKAVWAAYQRALALGQK
jgi:pyrroline-5-carboxylate reductase